METDAPARRTTRRESAIARVLRLQATAGNAAVTTMLSREPVPYGPPLDSDLPEGPVGAAPPWATDDLRRKLAAVVLAESAPGQEEQVRWIYLERVTRAGGESGLEGSSAYDEGIRYRLYLYTLGDPSHGDDPLRPSSNSAASQRSPTTARATPSGSRSVSRAPRRCAASSTR